MKNFLINIFYFSLIFVAINLVLFYTIVKPAVFEKYIYNEESISTYNYMLVGDSHGAYLKSSPNAFGIFNASYVSDNYHDMLLKIKYFTKKMPENATVFLSVDSHLFSEYRDGPGNIKKTISYVSGYDSLDTTFTNAEFFFKKLTKFMPLLDTDKNVLISDYVISSFGPSQHKNMINSIKDKPQKQLENDALNRIKYQFVNDEFSQQQLNYFLSIIDYCKTNNIRLICVRFPVTKPYWNYIKTYNYEIEEMLAVRDIEFLDLHALLFDKNEYFLDQDHMNMNGGSLFSENLISRLNR